MSSPSSKHLFPPRLISLHLIPYTIPCHTIPTYDAVHEVEELLDAVFALVAFAGLDALLAVVKVVLDVDALLGLGALCGWFRGGERRGEKRAGVCRTGDEWSATSMGVE